MNYRTHEGSARSELDLKPLVELLSIGATAGSANPNLLPNGKQAIGFVVNHMW